MPEAAAVNIRNRSYTIAAEVNIEKQQAEGVLFAQGCQFGGHSLYIKDGLLKYVYNFCGMFEQKVMSSEKVPLGKCVLSAVFVREGEDMPTHRTLVLYINDKAVGSGRDQNPTRKILTSWRRSLRRTRWCRTSDQRLCSWQAMDFRWRHDQASDSWM